MSYVHSKRYLSLLVLLLMTWSFEAEAQYVRTEIVSPRPGNAVASGRRLLRALGRLTGASATDPYLLKIEPGIYDLDGASLAMLPYVDIEGSGEGVTTIVSDVDVDGTVIGAEHSELREVTVENFGADSAYGIRNAADTFAATHVTATASGGATLSNAVETRGASVVLEHITARADSPQSAYGVVSRAGTLKHVFASVSAGDLCYAIFNLGHEGEFFDITAEAESGRFAAGLRNEAGAPVLRNIKLYAKGDGTGEGIVNGAGTRAQIYDVVIRAVSGGSARGIRNEFSSAVVANADISVEAASNGYGVLSLFEGTPSFSNVRVDVESSGNGIGFYADDDVHASLERSTIRSDGFSLANGFTSAATSIGAATSMLEGPVRPALGAIRCVASYDETFTPLDRTCSPIP